MKVRNTLIAISVALTIGGCGGSSNHNTAASSTNTTAAGSNTTSAAASATSTTAAGATGTTVAGTAAANGNAPALPAVCSMVTPSQLTPLLGAPVAGVGTEDDPNPTYKTCTWNTDQSTGNVNLVRLAVIVKKSPSDNGFSSSGSAGTPAPVSGLGDNANFASRGGAAGQDGESQLIANKGLVSVSIDVRYGGSVAHPNSNSAAMGVVVRDVFSQLSA